MKVLVTGANGFLGKEVVRRLLAEGHYVRALVRPSAVLREMPQGEGLEIFRGDLRNSLDLDSACSGVDALVHLAAAVSGTEEFQLASTVVGTERLFKALETAPAIRVILASSFSVYQWTRVGRLLSEDSPLEREDLCDRDPYAVAKIMQERFVTRVCREQGRPLTILRPGLIWGRDHFHDWAPGQRVGNLYFVVGPFRELPLVYVKHCAEAFVRALQSPPVPYVCFNVTDDHRVSANRFFNDVIRKKGEKVVPVPHFLAYATVLLLDVVNRLFFKRRLRLPGMVMRCRFAARFTTCRFSSKALTQKTGWKPAMSYEACLKESSMR